MRQHGSLARRRHRHAEIMAQLLIGWSMMQARDKRAAQERQAERERVWKETAAAAEYYSRNITGRPSMIIVDDAGSVPSQVYKP